MNYLKAKKSRENSDFKDVNEYVSHVDAFARTCNKLTDQEQADKRVAYSKIISQQRTQNEDANDQSPTFRARRPESCGDKLGCSRRHDTDEKGNKGKP